MSKTKKLAAIAIAAVTLAGSAFAFSGCCNHSSETKYYKATCTQAGYEEEICFKCGETLRHEQTAAALGHDFDGGFCTRCDEPDPNDNTLSDEAGKLNLTADGVLSWDKLKTATKYELSLTLPNETEPVVYEFDKKKGSVKLDELIKVDGTDKTAPLPTGRTFAKFLHYEMHTETVEGEKIEQEFPVEEEADEFRILKVNGRFELVRMGYSDENVTLSGFYSQPKTDENGNKYYLYEVVIEDSSKPQRFNISKQVKAASGNKAAYYKTAEDRQREQNALSQFDLPNMFIPAGASTFYMRLKLADGGYKDYDLRVYGLRNMEITVYGGISNGVDISRSVYKTVSCLEGDIIPSGEFTNAISGKYTVTDGNFNKIGDIEIKSDFATNTYSYSGADYTAVANGSDKAELYVYETRLVDRIIAGYAAWSETYKLSVVWGDDDILKGYALKYLNASDATEAVVPTYIVDSNNSAMSVWLGVVSADFSLADKLTAIEIEQMYTMPKLVLSQSITTVNLRQMEEMHAGAFMGANPNLVINCSVSKAYADEKYPAKWNYNNVEGIYGKPYTTNYEVEF